MRRRANRKDEQKSASKKPATQEITTGGKDGPRFRLARRTPSGDGDGATADGDGIDGDTAAEDLPDRDGGSADGVGRDGIDAATVVDAGKFVDEASESGAVVEDEETTLATICLRDKLI